MHFGMRKINNKECYICFKEYDETIVLYPHPHRPIPFQRLDSVIHTFFYLLQSLQCTPILSLQSRPYPTFFFFSISDMQKSTSFSDSRTGKPRPANIISNRQHSTETLPWPSPSLDVFKASHQDVAVSADPGRPSSQVRTSPTGRMPPTPLTASYKPFTETQDNYMSQQVRLPGVQDLLANSPPTSEKLLTVPLPTEEIGPRSARLKTIPLPYVGDAAPPMQQSLSEAGTSAQPAFVSARRPQLSPNTFREMPSSDEVQGLGLDLGEETPRIDSHGDMEMRTPTVSECPRIPGAPQPNSGRMAPFITSPINPPLRNWNTDLRFDNSRAQQVRPRFLQRSFSDLPRREATAMERERTVELEGEMPHGNKLWGLAISMDNGQTYQRGSYLYRADGSIIGPAALVQAPPTPNKSTQQRMASNNISKAAVEPSSSATPLTTKFRAVGLTPHIHKTRLTPTLSSKGKTSPQSNVESPSLKMKSKQRSEQLREQAASVAAQRSLPSDLITIVPGGGIVPHGSIPSPADRFSTPVRPVSSPTSPTGDSFGAQALLDMQTHPRTAPSSTSPRKRGLQTRESNQDRVTPKTSDKTDVTSTSPWGVFEIHSNNSSWQPLGPPALSNVLGKLNLDETNDEEGDEESCSVKSKRQRKGVREVKENAQNDRQRSVSLTKGQYVRSGSASSSGEEKENDVFGSFGRRTPNIPSSPVKQHSQSQQRRLLSIR